MRPSYLIRTEVLESTDYLSHAFYINWNYTLRTTDTKATSKHSGVQSFSEY
jgi:hypothetical protein